MGISELFILFFMLAVVALPVALVMALIGHFSRKKLSTPQQ
jgi:hypothetical protein